MFRFSIFNNKLALLLSISLLCTHLTLEANELASLSDNSQKHQEILHVEPPFWWIGMQEPNLQLMLHGDNIARFDVKSSNQNLKVISIEQVSSRNYLFVNLHISKQSKAGSFQIQLLENDQISQIINYQLKQRKADSHQRKGFNTSDVIYLITPDRFANGDYKNDQVASLTEGVNRKNPDGRHGGDIQGVIDHLDYISDMGFTQIWLNPLVENNQEQYSYHGYSATDLYQVDARFGDNQQYKLLSEKARQKGLGIIYDAVLNHIGSNHWWMKDIPSEDWINHQGNYVLTSHKRESLRDPHGTVEDQIAFTDGWFVPTMPDLNQRNKFVANYLIQNNIWWIELAELSGIRIDTFSYSDKQFLEDYTRRIMNEYPNFNLVAEEWSLNPNIVSYWQKNKVRHDDFDYQLPSIMDFPLQDALVKSLKETESWSDGLQKLYSTLANDFVYADSNALVIFPDNHDMSRIFSQLEHDQALTKMALVFLATTRGIPQFFYGTEIAMDNRGTHAHGVIRTDFPGGWQNDSTNGFSTKGLTKVQKSMQDFTRKLLNWRKKTQVIHKGKLTHYAPKDGVYVYFRHNDLDKVMVILNKNHKAIDVNPDDFPSMLSVEDKKKIGMEVLSGNKVFMNQSIKVPAKSALIIQLNNES